MQDMSYTSLFCEYSLNMVINMAVLQQWSKLESGNTVAF